MTDNAKTDRAILMVVGLVPDKLGAYERFMISFAGRGKKRGLAVDFLLAGEPLPEIKDALSLAGSTVFVMEDWLAGTRRDQERRFVVRYADLTRKRQYRLVSFSFCDTLSVLLALWPHAFHGRRPKALWHQHSEQARPRSFVEKRLSLLKIASWFMAGVCPVYDGAVQTMRERGIASRKIFTLGNGVVDCAMTLDQVAQKRGELGAAPNDFLLLTVASLIERKNIPMLLHAFSSALVKMPSLLLAVAGDGELERSLRDLSCQLKVSERVRWLGRRNDIAELCVAADLGVITSRAEALPFFCIESFAARRTMIATPAGGVPEIVQHGVNGIIVPFDDSQRLATEILLLAQDSALRRSYEKAAGETYLTRYTLDQMVESYLDAYCRFV